MINHFYFKGGTLSIDDLAYKTNSIEACALEDGLGIVPDKLDFIRPDKEASLDLYYPASKLRSGDLFLVLTDVCTPEQLLQNNWRRMHGLPMKRRRRK